MPYYLDILPAVPIPRPGPQTFTWRSFRTFERGAIVRAPFRHRVVLGMVMGSHKAPPKFRGRIREITSVVSETPFFSPPREKFFWWITESSVSPPSLVLARFLPAWLKTGTTHPFPADNTKLFQEKFLFGENKAARCMKIVEYAKSFSKAQSLVLVPDGMRAKELFIYFQKNRVPNPIMLTGMSPALRRNLWNTIWSGVPLSVIGTPDALFLPFVSLKGVIVIDETNSLYGFERKAPFFHVADAARVLAKSFGAPLVLEGALPSIKTFKDHPLVTLPQTKQALIISMRHSRRGMLFEEELKEELQKILANKGRAILFINRKGTASLMVCRACGKPVTCPNCDIPMPYWRSPRLAASSVQSELLRCRHCAYEMPPPMACPSCHSWSLKPSGIGSTAVAEAATKLFYDTRVLRLDSEVTPRSKEQHMVLEEFTRQKKTILVATQMLFGKMLPKVDVVGIIAADQLLAMPDFQAEERLFATVSRLQEFLKHKGKMYLQTWKPENPAITTAVAGDYKSFAKKELQLRREFGWPPFSRLAKLIVRHRDKKAAESEAQNLAKKLKAISGTLKTEIIGPHPAFIPRIRGKYVFHIILKWKPKGLEDVRVEKLLWTVVSRDWEVSINPESIV